ncbi:transcriptional regulator EutR [Pseudovibrio axinellae]|uniref:Transcriptional regulator EutR n=1 Tax=Pseudovibrio axinellae TaxID=989403 RepID=A0A165SZ39_9HYPH|nr:AraC family transcriptional regulator [Pseudovibrio axinellae]KZL05052.1 transcriptional regulator EutR [Pseudovibrio axinellae]SER66031.1 transcriptional regulator, AraC family [Pseudovibrio axinellae]
MVLAKNRDREAISRSAPLSKWPLFKTSCLDEAREKVARVYCDHRLNMVGKGQFRARQNRLAGSAVSINFLEYGTKAHIAPGDLGSFYLFQFPLRGNASICNGSNHHEIGGGTGSTLNPDCDTRMIWDEKCAQLMLQVDRRTLEHQARAFFGLPEERHIRFSGPTDLLKGMGHAFINLLNYVIHEASCGNVMIGCDSVISRQLEQTLILGLLETHPHNLKRGDATSGRFNGPAPKIVRQAEAYIEAHLQQSITVADIALATGVSVRTLQSTFRAYRDRSPLEVIRDMKLEKAWIDLSNPTPQTTVTNTATAWGFFHLGRFAEQYRQKFGCTPKETLRQSLHL